MVTNPLKTSHDCPHGPLACSWFNLHGSDMYILLSKSQGSAFNCRGSEKTAYDLKKLLKTKRYLTRYA